MESVLPFRVLSPGSGKAKNIQRNRETKLSLKSRKVGNVDKYGKENKQPLKVVESDLMTSDESDVESSIIRDLRKDSVMSLNTQESTFSLPAAESTRCEPPAKNLTGHVKSTVASLHTAHNGSSSSSGTEYFTACPFPVGCDESIVCISDSSPESVKRPVKKITGPTVSMLLTDDESDSESDRKIFNSLKKPLAEDKKLCDTVIIDSSDDEDQEVVRKNTKGDFVISPSEKSIESSDDNSVSTYNNREKAMKNKCDVVIPPSPSKFSEISEIISNSEDDNISCHSSRRMKVVSRRKSRLQLCRKPLNENPSQESKSLANPEINESSWKDDFHLILQESVLSKADNVNLEEESTKADTPKKVSGTISKEKYNDIARWLVSGRESGSSSEDLTSCCKDEKQDIQKGKPVSQSQTPKPAQVRSLTLGRRASAGSESDDNFEALMASIRKKREEELKNPVSNSNVDHNDSFIDDGCESDLVESPSFNVYHSDLTRSIKAEVNSVKKSVQSMKKKVFGHLFDSDENSEGGRHKTPCMKTADLKSSFRKVRHVRAFQIDTDESDSETDDAQKVSQTESDDNYDSDKADNSAPARVKVRVHEKSNIRKNGRNLKTLESSESDESEPEEPVQPKVADRKKSFKIPGSSSGSSTSISLKSDISKPHPKRTKKPSRVPEGVLLQKTPKNIASLKSPRTPFSPIRTFLSSLSGPTHEPGVRDHPEAAVYNKNFKGKKEELTRRLFKLFNREVFDRRLPDDMVLEWNARLVRTAGLCYCKLARKGGVVESRTAKIALSTKVITSPDRLRDTLIHEMCHAAVWLLNNISGGHGPFWKAWANKAMKRFPELPPIERCHSYNIETKFTYRCTKCGYSFGRHSKSLDIDKKRCGYCYGTFEVFLSSKGQSNQEKVLKTPKAPNAFALFVKENYGVLKQEHVNLKHGDIMKKLSEKFASMKVKQLDN